MLKLLRIGATHATELPYVFGNLVQGPLDITFKLGVLSTGQAVSTRILARWLNFATHATPTGLSEEPEWKPYRDPGRACLVIDSTGSVINDADADIRAAWGTRC
jgi:para-nitrobenzyl esterase